MAISHAKKVGLLALMLIFPVLIYLFLQGFGSNEYDLPLYFESGVDTLGIQCTAEEHQSILLDVLGGKEDKNTFLLLDFGWPASQSEAEAWENELSRLYYSIEERHAFRFFCIVPDTAVDADIYGGLLGTHWEQILVDSGSFMEVVNCAFGLGEEQYSSQILLVDDQLKIRGFYGKWDRQEVDRLIMEIEILNKVYYGNRSKK